MCFVGLALSFSENHFRVTPKLLAKLKLLVSIPLNAHIVSFECWMVFDSSMFVDFYIFCIYLVSFVFGSKEFSSIEVFLKSGMCVSVCGPCEYYGQNGNFWFLFYSHLTFTHSNLPLPDLCFVQWLFPAFSLANFMWKGFIFLANVSGFICCSYLAKLTLSFVAKTWRQI